MQRRTIRGAAASSSRLQRCFATRARDDSWRRARGIAASRRTLRPREAASRPRRDARAACAKQARRDLLASHAMLGDRGTASRCCSSARAGRRGVAGDGHSKRRRFERPPRVGGPRRATSRRPGGAADRPGS
jgi:hypothetical protein